MQFNFPSATDPFTYSFESIGGAKVLFLTVRAINIKVDILVVWNSGEVEYKLRDTYDEIKNLLEDLFSPTDRLTQAELNDLTSSPNATLLNGCVAIDHQKKIIGGASHTIATRNYEVYPTQIVLKRRIELSLDGI